MNRIESCIFEYRSWCKRLGISKASDINALIDQCQGDWLINVSEIWQEQKISEIAKAIKDDIARKKIILISGPSSSGKTSFATRLQLHLRVLGISSVSVSLDDYYLPRIQVPLNENGKPDFETIESIDYNRFNENAAELITGGTALLPKFDFKTGLPFPESRSVSLASNEVVIIEGIHGLNPKITANIPDENKYMIYCSALAALFMDNGQRIRSRSTRLIRRIVRDYYFRNSSCADTISMWADVEAGAEKYIFPYTDRADIIFNSSLLYELAVYRKHMAQICADMKGNPQVAELLGIVGSFHDIDDDRTPRSSIVREFIGGSTLIC